MRGTHSLRHEKEEKEEEETRREECANAMRTGVKMASAMAKRSCAIRSADFEISRINLLRVALQEASPTVSKL